MLNLLFLCSSSSYSVVNCLCRCEIPMRKIIFLRKIMLLNIDYRFSCWIHTSFSLWTIAHCFDFWARTGSVRLPRRSQGWVPLVRVVLVREVWCRGPILSGRYLRSTFSGSSQGPTLKEESLGLNGVRRESRAHLVTEESWAHLEREDFKTQLVR